MAGSGRWSMLSRLREVRRARRALSRRYAEARQAFRESPYGEAAVSVLGPVARWLAPVTALGWGFLGAAVLGVLVWRSTGWNEALAASATVAILILISFVLSWWQGHMEVELSVTATSVGVGDPVDGRLDVRRPGRETLLPAMVEVPVGEGCGCFHLLQGRAVHSEPFTVLTRRRGVIEVGPARSVSGDPFGLVRREQLWSDTLEVCVHPRTVPLPSLDAGLIRDLEGRTTTDPSPSDLDFHTVRPYVPADDRRHVHWKATARSRSTGQSQSLLVKQYYDTRRSHLGLLVDIDPARYRDEEEVELALEVAASLAVRARRDELDVTVAAGPKLIDAPVIARLLDGFARVEPGPVRMVDSALRLVGVAPQLSLVVFVVGPNSDQGDLRLALSVLPVTVRAVMLRIDPEVESGPSAFPGAVALTLARSSDLRRLVRGGGL